VLTSNAVGFISPSSAAPTKPRERSLSTRWMVKTSARLNNSSLDTYVAPACSAACGVRFVLHAMTSMPNALPTRATLAPIRPKPSTPNTVLPSCRPTDVCHPPPRTDRLSSTIRRAAVRISAQVSSTVDST